MMERREGGHKNEKRKQDEAANTRTQGGDAIRELEGTNILSTDPSYISISAIRPQYRLFSSGRPVNGTTRANNILMWIGLYLQDEGQLSYVYVNAALDTNSQQLSPRFRNNLTSSIIDFLEIDLWKWIDPHGIDPLAIPERFKMSPSPVLCLDHSTSIDDIEKETLCVLLAYADLISTKFGEHARWKLPRYHTIWVSDNGRCNYPEPDLRDILFDPPKNLCIKGLLLLMNYSGRYDGDTDFIFERRFPLALKLLFSCVDAAVASVNLDGSSGNEFSLLFIYESPELTDNARELLAKASHPTLLRLLYLHGNKDVLPPHCFVYGLHVSRMHLSIFAHFPVRRVASNDTDGWEFAQVLLAKHLIPGDPTDVYGHVDQFLSRWRALIALLTILKHVQFQSHEMKIGSTGGQSVKMQKPFSLGKCLHPQLQRLSQFPGRLKALSASWKGSQFAVPSDWIIPDHYEINPSILRTKRDMALLLQCQITAIAMHRIQMFLTPLSKSDLAHNHLTQESCSPDFLLSTHSPRSRFSKYSMEPVDPECNTLSHLYKAHSLLVMSAPSWEDVPVFIANLFSGFSPYAVQWLPVIQYPFSVSSPPSDLCVVDFALAVRTIPATTCATIERAAKLPLTIGSPAVLICAHSHRLEESGQVISGDEVTALIGIMKPHLQLFQSLEYYDSLTFVPDHSGPDPYPTLFCIYVKMGFLHILAFTCEPRSSGPNIHSYLVDSLPMSLNYETETDLCDRMRIVMALFTLQREVVKISDGWGSICWPSNLLNEEHEKIVQLTGIHTPNATENLSEPGEELHVFFDESEDDMEDDPEVMKKQIAASVERVIAWRSRLEPSDEGDSDIVMEDVW
ncbi:hypothetical protein NM688_g6728 [Phlebia brevispora]|uniref:Uncharacterized protein n=1 Tax=Phlebia brevispora TaxID=194682 RepID=A0ACC1SCZ8_9APHY|nr:hypothetical protein NM688_g6728 [Phlebia brevispora]